MYLKNHINFINWWSTTLNISRRATFLSCALKSMQIFYAISCEMIWQTTFFWKCVTSSIRPACNLLAYTGYLNLYFYMSLERSMSCSWTSMCPPLTDPYKQTNKILNSSISAKDSFKSIPLLPWMQYRPHVNSLYKSSINVVSFV